MRAKRLQLTEVLPGLPEEIVTGILLKLPVKSLLKFRCVSKSWLKLISKYRFAKEHIKISTKNNVNAHDRIIFGSNSFPLDLYADSIQSAAQKFIPTGHIYPSTGQHLPSHRVWFDYSSYEPHPRVMLQLVGSCNGLICLSLCFGALILWNPATRKSKSLPNSGTDLNCGYLGKTFGFGYDDIHDDYKVMEYLFLPSVSTMIAIQVKVYSLRANSWKTLLNCPAGEVFGGSVKYLNGALHWSASEFEEFGCWDIVSLDLVSDTFKVLSPPTFEDNDVIVDVNVIQGCLALCCEHNTHMDVWLMKEYGVRESWNKVVRVPFYLDFRDHDFLRPVLFFLLADGRILMNYGSNLRIYDPRNPQNHHFSGVDAVEAVTYFESLVSPNFDDGTHAFDGH